MKPMRDTKDGSQMHICFFCKVNDRSDFKRVGFYADDIRILEELGYKVSVATSFSEIPSDVDAIYAWWWTWAFIPLMKKRFKGIPVVICGVFDYSTPPRGQRMCYLDRPWWQQVILRLALRQADANIFISEFEFRQITELFPVNNPKLIPCAVDTESYRPAEKEERGRFLFNVAWSGGYNLERKCLREIISGFAYAAKRVPDLTLVMAGKQGEFHHLLVETAQKEGVADLVQFLGPISHEKKIHLMQTCMAYVQPTLFEGFGLAIAEAMACGAPVVTSPVGAVTEVVGQTGILVKNESAEEIGEAIIKLEKDPELRRTFSKLGAERIRSTFSYQRRKTAIQEVMVETLRRSGVPLQSHGVDTSPTGLAPNLNTELEIRK